jgi:hypothetical protein
MHMARQARAKKPARPVTEVRSDLRSVARYLEEQSELDPGPTKTAEMGGGMPHRVSGEPRTVARPRVWPSPSSWKPGHSQKSGQVALLKLTGKA